MMQELVILLTLLVASATIVDRLYQALLVLAEVLDSEVKAFFRYSVRPPMPEDTSSTR